MTDIYIGDIEVLLETVKFCWDASKDGAEKCRCLERVYEASYEALKEAHTCCDL